MGHLTLPAQFHSAIIDNAATVRDSARHRTTVALQLCFTDFDT
jgi:hypothetical protein